MNIKAQIDKMMGPDFEAKYEAARKFDQELIDRAVALGIENKEVSEMMTALGYKEADITNFQEVTEQLAEVLPAEMTGTAFLFGMHVATLYWTVTQNSKALPATASSGPTPE